jgi:hypothetical protein
MSHSKLHALYPDEHSEIEIKWSRPMDYDKALEKEDDGQENFFFYKIMAFYKRTNTYKLLYIGKSYNHHVSKRLKNPDHKRKRLKFEKDFARHQLKVSFGAFESWDRKPTKLLIDKVESLLIYAHSSEDFPDMTNRSNSWSHGVKRAYLITNIGFRKDRMYKEISMGVFYKP